MKLWSFNNWVVKYIDVTEADIRWHSSETSPLYRQRVCPLSPTRSLSPFSQRPGIYTSATSIQHSGNGNGLNGWDAVGHQSKAPLIQQGQCQTRPGIRWSHFYLSTSATSIQHSGNRHNGWDAVRHQSKALVAPESAKFQQGSHCHTDIKNPEVGRCPLLVTGDEFNAL